MVQKTLNVVVVQADLAWREPAKNLLSLGQTLSNLENGVDLILLPEMFTSGFTSHPERLAGEMEALQWMQSEAVRLDAAICGSVALEVEGVFLNRLYFVPPKGDPVHYDKVHLFSMGGEHKRYTPGDRRVVVGYRGWRLLLTVCYDLRFPVFCRNRKDYDVMLCAANWPSARSHAWKTLLAARAIENQSFVLGCNRVGVDGNGIEYSGDSVVLRPGGDAMASLERGRAGLLSARLDHDELNGFRRKNPFLQDADNFELTDIGLSAI